MCSTDLSSCHQNLLGGAGHQKGSNPEGEYHTYLPKLATGRGLLWGPIKPKSGACLVWNLCQWDNC